MQVDVERHIREARIRRHLVLWEMHIPKKAQNVESGETHTMFVHPTKGKRRIANCRLGLPL